ncbi:tail protein X [Idiomarina sp.]|uniref:tail protein X n=1 Tax=Idiomarina sp. TaxID=1874361 RepID=UPI003A8F5962
MEVRAQQGDTVDVICQRHLRRTAGVTEQTLELNPGLAELGPVIPRGTLITLPEVTAPPRKKMIQLWD